MIPAAATAACVSFATVLVGLIVSGERRRGLVNDLSPELGRSSRLRVPSWVPVAAGVPAAWFLGGRVAGYVGSVTASVVVLAIPKLASRRRGRRRDREIRDRLAEAVSLIASALRSGRSLLQAIELTAQDVDPLLGVTFRRLADRAGLGDPMDEAIDAWAMDVGGPDARLVATVLKLHRRTGGSLAATLSDVAQTLRSRRTASREIESLTAQARLSATILGLLPVGFFVFLSVVSRRDLQAVYETPAGTAAIVVGFALQGAAYIWIRRLLRVTP